MFLAHIILQFGVRAFFSTLAEECILYQSKGDVLLLGDFNARIGTVSRDTDCNTNGAKFLEFLRIAFGPPVDGKYPCLLTCSDKLLGTPTRAKNAHFSIIDYLICLSSTIKKRVSKVHVETDNQDLGANGCGSDHHLFWVGWHLADSLDSSPSLEATPSYCLCWDKEALSNSSVGTRLCDALGPNLLEWTKAVQALFQSKSLFKYLLHDDKQILIDGIYAQWNFLVHDALCQSVPVKSVGRQSKDWWDPVLQSLLGKCTAAHDALTSFCRSAQANAHKIISSDPSWQLLWSTYADLRKQAHDLAQSNKARR
jgi:hypothetical protein